MKQTEQEKFYKKMNDAFDGIVIGIFLLVVFSVLLYFFM